jgi:hypothetical protein
MQAKSLRTEERPPKVYVIKMSPESRTVMPVGQAESTDTGPLGMPAIDYHDGDSHAANLTASMFFPASLIGASFPWRRSR